MPRQFTFTLVWKFLLYLYFYIFCSTHPPPRSCIYGNECEEWPCWWLVSGRQRPNMVRMPWRILPYLLIIYLNYHLSLIHTLPATRGMARRGHLGQEPDDGDQFEFVTGRWVSTWTVFWWVLDSDRHIRLWGGACRTELSGNLVGVLVFGILEFLVALADVGAAW